MKPIDINELTKYVYEPEVLIIGSPKGVGFSTIVAEIIAHQIFFKEDFSALILTENDRNRIGMLFKIKEAYNYFGLSLTQDKNILFSKSGDSGVCVINYNEYLLETIDTKHDMIIVDSDYCSNYLYENFGRLAEYSKTLWFNTEDLPQSIFYNLDFERVDFQLKQNKNIDIKKIILTSKYSIENINKNYGQHPNSINYDRLLLGEFKT